jgi:hypothetical protein
VLTIFSTLIATPLIIVVRNLFPELMDEIRRWRSNFSDARRLSIGWLYPQFSGLSHKKY